MCFRQQTTMLNFYEKVFSKKKETIYNFRISICVFIVKLLDKKLVVY